MVTKKEQLAQQVQDAYNKGIATGQTHDQVIGAMKDKLQTTGQYDAMKQVATGTKTNTPTTPTQSDLENKIKSGNFSASDARQYNQMTGNNQGARELALGSQQAVQNLNTTVTPQEAKTMQEKGITNVGQGVKPDLTNATKEDFKQALDTTKVTTQETPTGTVTTTETPKESKIENIDQFKQAGGGLSNLEQLVENRYGTVAAQEQDGISAVINGEKFKWTIDNAGNPVKTSLGRVETQTPDKIFQTIAGGGQIDTNTKGYTEAKARFDTYSKYKDFTDKQFQTAFNEGLILPGTQLYNDLSKNPKIKLQMDKANALNRVNGEKTDPNKVFETQSEEIGNNTNVEVGGKTMTLTKALEDGYLSKSEYDQFTNTSEVIAKSEEVEKLKNRADELQNIYDNVRTEVEEQLKGTGATKSDLESIVGERQKNMLGNLNLAISKYNNALGTLTELKKTNTEMFATNLSLYQSQQAQKQALEAEQRQRGYTIEDRKYASEQQATQTQQAFENQKKLLALQEQYRDQPTTIITDEATGKQSLINTQTGTVIASYNTGFKPQQATQDWTKLNDNTMYNQRTGETRALQGTTSTGYTPTNRYDFIKKSEGFSPTAYQDSTGKWTIGYGFTSLNGKPVKQGDTMTQAQADKAMVDIANKYTNFKNFVKVPLSEAQQTALNSFEYNLGQNIWSGTGKTIIDKINAGDFAGAGQEMLKFNRALNPATGQKEVLNGLTTRRQREADLLQQTGGTTGKQYTDEQISDLNYISDLLEKTPTEGRKALKEMGYTDNDVANFKSGNYPLTEKQKAMSISVMDDIKTLLKNYDWNDAVGKFDYSRAFGFQDAEDAKVVIENLAAKLTLPNLGLLKGPMSDNDLRFIKNASTKLSTEQSNRAFENNLVEAYNMSARRAGMPEVKTIKDIIKGQVKTTGTSTQNNAINYLNSLGY